MKQVLSIPSFIINICKTLHEAGYEAYLVGGALRDMIMGRETHDFDLATDALPQEISEVFPKAKAYGNFGTMLLIADKKKVEITPYRDDAPGRKPDYSFGGTIYTDLARRDFTMNSMAFDPLNKQFLDPYRGLQDIDLKLIRCTGSTKRIWEDPLRAVRAARFQAQLGFSIETSTLYALKAHAESLTEISQERIRDELSLTITGDHAFDGLMTLVVTDLLEYIIPELVEGMGIMHYNKPVDVLEHNLIACKTIRNNLSLRLAALLHDVAKPSTAKLDKKGLIFPDHHVESALLAEKILKRLRFDNETIKKVVLLIKHHMFYYTPNSPLSDARLLVSRVGWDNIYDLIDLRIADRIASGFDRAIGKGLEKLLHDLEKLKKEDSDYQVKDLAITGKDLMNELNISPGPEIGKILRELLNRVIECPDINEKNLLLELAEKIHI